ncbi:hypothetical protein [Arundinibacter roseus]|uniref:hypothetical protein n=1 Tax=Arundinibacter roseus TaxID=2070510 RepID=UPI003742BAC1
MFKLAREWRKSGLSQSKFCKPQGKKVDRLLLGEKRKIMPRGGSPKSLRLCCVIRPTASLR